MKIIHEITWPISAVEAIEFQEIWRRKVIRKNKFKRLQKVAGVDASYKNGKALAAVVVLSYPDLSVLDQSTIVMPIHFPYVPGLLAFREGPAVVEAFRHLATEPDLIIFDSQGLAHPRRFGLACHLGIILNKSTIGCAKSRLIGQPCQSLSNEEGAWVKLLDDGEVVGAVLRSRTGSGPLYVSLGHKIDLKTSVEVVLNCLRPSQRLPETTRLAHQLAATLF